MKKQVTQHAVYDSPYWTNIRLYKCCYVETFYFPFKKRPAECLYNSLGLVGV